MKSLLAFDPIATSPLDSISTAQVTSFISKRRKAKLKVSSINRELEVLRRMLHLAFEWGHLEKPALRVQMLPGENERDRVLTTDEESRYLKASAAVGDSILAAHARALVGIRAQLRGEIPAEPNDPFLLRDVTTILLDCGLRPEESFRLRWQHVQNDVLHIPFGKTENARRRIPLTQRAAALLSMRRGAHSEEWVFPAPTRTGHIEKSSLRKQHRALRLLYLPGQYVLPEFFTGPERKKASSRAALHNLPSVLFRPLRGCPDSYRFAHLVHLVRNVLVLTQPLFHSVPGDP